MQQEATSVAAASLKWRQAFGHGPSHKEPAVGGGALSDTSLRLRAPLRTQTCLLVTGPPVLLSVPVCLSVCLSGCSVCRVFVYLSMSVCLSVSLTV